MFHIAKNINLIIKNTFLFGGLLFAASLALLPISAQAQFFPQPQCQKWEVSREMLIIQPGFHSSLTLEQNGAVITGKAWGSILDEDGTRTITAGGTVDGSLVGSSFYIKIYWYNDHTGIYSGRVLPSGRLDGVGYEQRSPKVRVPWHSEGVLKCVATPPPPPPATPKPIKSTGKARPAPTPAPPPTPPYIIAGPPIAIPHLPYGTVGLGWDGGPENPNVEVFVSMDGGPQTAAFAIDIPPGHPLFKQPKGGVELKLQKGRTYKFALKSGNATLSTVTFFVPPF